jgi:hypothetical protein
MTQIIDPITESYGSQEYSLTVVENDPAPPIEHITLGLSRVIKQFQNSLNFLAYITALLAQNDTCEDLLQSMYELPSIQAMSGVNLDVIGRIVGISRDIPNAITLSYFGWSELSTGDPDTGAEPWGELDQPGIGGRWYDLGDPLLATTILPDAEYRLLLLAKIVKNSSKGSGPEIENLLAFLFSVSLVNVVDYGSMEIGLQIGRPLSQTEQAMLTNIDLLPRPACVLIDSVTTFLGVGAFGFSELSSGSIPPGALGWEELNNPGVGGVWAELFVPAVASQKLSFSEQAQDTEQTSY